MIAGPQEWEKFFPNCDHLAAAANDSALQNNRFDSRLPDPSAADFPIKSQKSG